MQAVPAEARRRKWLVRLSGTVYSPPQATSGTDGDGLPVLIAYFAGPVSLAGA